MRSAELSMDAGAATCVAADPRGFRVFTGDANGFVRCFAREAESGRAGAPAGRAEVPAMMAPQWTARAAQDAVLVRTVGRRCCCC